MIHVCNMSIFLLGFDVVKVVVNKQPLTFNMTPDSCIKKWRYSLVKSGMWPHKKYDAVDIYILLRSWFYDTCTCPQTQPAPSSWYHTHTVWEGQGCRSSFCSSGTEKTSALSARLYTEILFWRYCALFSRSTSYDSNPRQLQMALKVSRTALYHD